MNKPRRHHYCPAGYLQNFATPCDRYGKLIVTDSKTAAERPSTPDKEAHQRDYYRIDVASEQDDPFILEDEFSRIEGPAARAIRSIIETGRLPDDEQMNWLIGFVGLLSTRVPSVRERMEKFGQEFYRTAARLTVTSRQSFKSYLESARAEGRPIPDITFEEAQEHFNSDSFDIGISRNEQLLTMLDMASAITDLLLQRSWSLVVAQGSKEFITCDHPVVLRWIEPVPGFRGPGFGLKNTEVSITLSPKHALLGVYADIPETVYVGDRAVAGTNEYMHLRAKRWLYSKSGSPCTIAKDGSIVSLRERLAEI